MPRVAANGIQLFYEDAGDTAAPAVLMVMGLGTQLTAWPERMVAGLVDAGYRVIRFDNRDIGLSTTLDGARAIHPLLALAMMRLGMQVPLAYTLTDMAADAVALLDALGIARAHIVGASMGGMIAQLVASGWSERVLTLTSIMSSSGRRGLPGPTARLRGQLMRRRPADAPRDSVIADGIAMLTLISHPDADRGAHEFRDLAAAAYDRGYNPMGIRRQLLAILGDGSRVDRLKAICAPTLLIHGAADPLVPAAHGEDLARAIPHARLVTVPGMAHDFPPSKLPLMVATIAAHLDGGAVRLPPSEHGLI